LETEPWQREIARAITDPRELLDLLGLDPADLPYPVWPEAPFTMRVPRYFAGLMQPGDPLDPLLAQVLPSRQENHVATGFVTDPVGDRHASLAHGLLQKYRGRALLLTTGSCAVHCRYCFRRHYPYAEDTGPRHWGDALATLEERTDISELILSGGDPLSLSDNRLATIVTAAENLPHLQRLRIHTRQPVVLPSRITGQLAKMLAASRLQTIVVIHANHPNEITSTLGAALRTLTMAVPGLWLLNQSVLLKSVNDDADTLVALSEKLSAIGVLPYYLHLLDPVEGAAHFDTPVQRARKLVEQIRARLPGYLVPTLVTEQAGEPAKTPL
jgi:EF-P beta-lysylation protein EpmB